MRLLTLALLSLAMGSPGFHARATVDDALSFAYEGATPYVEEGFVFREDAWGGDLGLKEQKAVMAQLYKGNEYWFIAATDSGNAVVTVHLYDSDGKLAESRQWQRGRFAGAYISPSRTGTYWAIITVESSPLERTPWALVYGFR